MARRPPPRRLETAAAAAAVGEVVAVAVGGEVGAGVEER